MPGPVDHGEERGFTLSKREPWEGPEPRAVPILRHSVCIKYTFSAQVTMAWGGPDKSLHSEGCNFCSLA